MSKHPQKHRLTVAKRNHPRKNPPNIGFRTKPHWWAMCTCGWYQGWHNKLDALNSRDKHQAEVEAEKEANR